MTKSSQAMTSIDPGGASYALRPRRGVLQFKETPTEEATYFLKSESSWERAACSACCSAESNARALGLN